MLRSKTGCALQEWYEYMTKTKGLGKKKTIVAIARRLAELLWTLSGSGADYEQRRFRLPPPETLAERLATRLSN
jgi:hypothetical protein